MIKFFTWAFLSVLIAAIGLLPEIVMYFLYGLVSPTTELAKIALLAVFWLGGGGLCVMFGFLAFAAWVAMTQDFL